MKNKVKYAQTRKYRDVGFNEVAEEQPRIRPRRSILIKRKKSFFEKIKRAIKNFF
jgi:hypothetical protein